MSNQYPGGIIIANPTQPTATSASGIWTTNQAENYAKQGIWPRSPGAPTIGTATAGSSACASVTFTAPSCIGSASITGYRVTSTPGCFTNTGASSPVVVSGLTAGTSYTFKAAATNGAGTGGTSAASNSITALSVGQQAFTCTGTYSWVAPTGVTSVSIVAVGAGRSGGGALVYGNNISVTPGTSYAVVVGAGNCASNTASKFATTVLVANGGAGTGTTATSSGSGKTGGGNGGVAATFGGGGGAGGYSGAGGNSQNNTSGLAGAGGGGGAGGGYSGCGPTFGGGGGGVGILGQGSNGAGGSGVGAGGGGGSGGANGSAGCCSNSGAPGAYGGGRGYNGSTGANGAVRIIWPGTTRSFPSTCTGNL